eukprot:GHVS01030790.1.p1 GENE.GHVS01030790.1~~GHVS01030790.1.p1  ORF type:complete len:230 (-),score=62.03 GHVS01030790.1:206-895(-)
MPKTISSQPQPQRLYSLNNNNSYITIIIMRAITTIMATAAITAQRLCASRRCASVLYVNNSFHQPPPPPPPPSPQSTSFFLPPPLHCHLLQTARGGGGSGGRGGGGRAFASGVVEVNKQFVEELLKDQGTKQKLLVDVRELWELQQHGQIPGSVHVPLGEVEQALKVLDDNLFRHKYGFSKPNKNESVLVFYCKSGARAQTACEVADKLGYADVHNYKGSYTDWFQKTY